MKLVKKSHTRFIRDHSGKVDRIVRSGDVSIVGHDLEQKIRKYKQDQRQKRRIRRKKNIKKVKSKAKKAQRWIDRNVPKPDDIEKILNKKYF